MRRGLLPLLLLLSACPSRPAADRAPRRAPPDRPAPVVAARPLPPAVVELDARLRAKERAAGSTRGDWLSWESIALDYMTSRWSEAKRIDAESIGAFGMSAGGFTVLTAAGARPDMRLIGPHCRTAPEFVCQVLQQLGSPLLVADTAWPGQPLQAAGRINAAVVAAPGLGFAFGPRGLAGVDVPVQLWSGEGDRRVPYETNAMLIQQGLGSVDFHSIPLAGHASFLTPCRLLRPSAVCADPDGFDREQFHRSMNQSVVEFFDRNLRPLR